MTDIGNDGERATINGSWGYYAHLSIYHFAVPYATGRRVLDVGSGTGYGAAYLARHGASVLALDGSTEAVAYSRQRFAGDAVTYEVANLNKPLPLGDAVFDVVFSSNVFEHVEHIDGLIGECARVLAHDGLMIVAVPPINSAGSAENDMRNRFHVHHIPPWAWAAKLGRWFFGRGVPRACRGSEPGDDAAGPAHAAGGRFRVPGVGSRRPAGAPVDNCGVRLPGGAACGSATGAR